MTAHQDLIARIAALEAKTVDAYSHYAYGKGEWRRAIRLLIDKGHDDRTIEAILRSKWMRWAADARPANEKIRGEGIIAWMNDPRNRIDRSQIEGLVMETFGDDHGLAGKCWTEDIADLITLARDVATNADTRLAPARAQAILARIALRNK